MHTGIQSPLFSRPRPPIRFFRQQWRLSTPDLVVLWVNRARHLAQQLHSTASITHPDHIPEDVTKIIRDGIKLLIDNMVILGHASIVYGPYGSEKRPEYFVPAEATTLFGMAEGLVDLYGYSGNGESVAWASLFDNLKILKTSMIINPQYMDRPIDFPHFVVNEEELRKYGIYDFVKRNQLSHILAKHAEFNRHKFGDNLRRYVVTGFPEEEVYKFSDPGDDEIPTRPNTPFVDEYMVRNSLGEMNTQGGVAMYGKERVVDENTKGEDVEGAGAKMESVE